MCHKGSDESGKEEAEAGIPRRRWWGGQVVVRLPGARLLSVANKSPKTQRSARLMCVFEVGHQANAQKIKENKKESGQRGNEATKQQPRANRQRTKTMLGKLPKHKSQFEHENVNKAKRKSKIQKVRAEAGGRRKCVSQLVVEVYNGADEKWQQAMAQQNQQLANEPESGRRERDREPERERRENNPLTRGEGRQLHPRSWTVARAM